MSSNLVYLLLVGLTATQLVLSTIEVHPITVHTTLGRNATFRCSVNDVDADELVWVMNGPATPINFEIYGDPNNEVIEFMRKRRIYYHEEGPVSVLNVEATVTNNATSFICKYIDFASAEFSTTAYLYILGPPLAPSISQNISNDVITFSWQTPFTWAGYDVTHYILSVSDSTGSERFSMESQNESYKYQYHIQDEVRDSCQAITFTGRAVSDLGWSEKSVSSTVLPRVPGVFGNVSFLVETSQRQLMVSVEPPDLCEHQEGNLTMLVLGDNSVAMLQVFQMYAGGNQLVQFTLGNTHFTQRNERSNYSLIFYLHQNDEGVNLTHSLPNHIVEALLQSPDSSQDLKKGLELDYKDIIIIVLSISSGVLLFSLIGVVVCSLIQSLRMKKKKDIEINGKGPVYINGL